MSELKGALDASGVADATIGVRGSAVTGKNWRTGKPFGPHSDIDVFAESSTLTEGLQTSKKTPGFVHPDKVHAAYPELKAWSERWSGILGHKVSVGGWVPGTRP
jgi:hypothetical protein